MILKLDTETLTASFGWHLVALMFDWRAAKQSAMPLPALNAMPTIAKENKMTRQDLAEFYKISTQAVGRWSKERKHRKTVQALAGAEQPICDLIADINKLAYIFDCANMRGIHQSRWCMVSRLPNRLTVIVFGGAGEKEFDVNIDMTAPDVAVRLILVKTKLEQLVYGVQGTY